MSVDTFNIIVNVVIFLVVFIGFFVFIGKANGWFKEGGLVYEWWQNKKREKKQKKS